MREILFRGKRKDNGEWVEGFYCKSLRWIGDKEPQISIQDNNCYFRLVTPSTVGQYTGLQDKNGVKIFEGDIFNDNEDDLVGFVIFRNGSLGVAWYGKSGELMEYGFDENAGEFKEIEFEPFDEIHSNRLEIIANIHDNPKWL